MTHGASSKTLFLPDENPSEFFDLLNDTFADCKPGSKQAAALVADSVQDYWILQRRRRAADHFEVQLYLRQPDSTQWTPAELHQIELLDRYRTTASRQYARSLTHIAKIKKLKYDDARWQQNLVLQKQRFDLALQRFNLAKNQHESARAAADDDDFDADLEAEIDLPNNPSPGASPTPGSVTQDLYIGLEGEKTVTYEVTPSNAHLRGTLTESDSVTRIYHFVGGVPEAYKHLVTPDAATWGKSTTVISSFPSTTGKT